MKNNKAMGPDDIPIEAWKAIGIKKAEILVKVLY